MTITVDLSPGGIQKAISRLEEICDSLEDGLEQTIEILTNEGAEIAQSAYGGMATATGIASGDRGTIVASGDAVPFAEFGAGDAVIGVDFENYPPYPVRSGAYSETEGSGEYATFGSWHFGGQKYTEILARAGLLSAKQYIQENSTEIAKEVIQL